MARFDRLFGVTITLPDCVHSAESAGTVRVVGLGDRFAIGNHGRDDFELGGILGMDFLRAARARIDLDQLTINFA